MTRFWLVFLIVAVPSLSFADETQQRSVFTLQDLPASKRDEVLRAAKFLRHDDDSRPQLNAETLREMGAVPAFSLEVENATIYLSFPYAFLGGRQIALAFVEVDEVVHCRVLYRSNSQFTWRLCDATSGGHIGKGFHEFDKQLPIPVTAALLSLYDKVAELRSAGDGDSKQSQAALAHLLFRGLTEDAQSGVRSGRVIRTSAGKYWSKEYAAYVASEPLSFSEVGGWLQTASSLRVADVEKISLPPAEKLPDVTHVLHAFQFESPAYAKLNEGKGMLNGKVFLSRDGTMRYLFFEDLHGRAVLSSVESLSPQINIFGLRNRYPDVAGMDAPLIEYNQQIPKQLGGSRKPGVRLNWNYVREQPIVKYYYRQQNRAVPPAEQK